MTTNTKILIGAAVILILFFGGYTVGYYKFTNRDGDQPSDYKSLLNEAANYIDSLEKKQQNLQQRIKTAGSRQGPSSTAVSPDNSEVHSTIKDLLAKTQSLESENADLREAISEMPNLRETADMTKDLKIQNQQLAAEAQAATEAKLALEKQHTALRSEAEQLAHSKSEKQKIARQLQDSRQYAADLEKEMNEMRGSLEQQQKIAAKASDVETKLQTCMSNNRQLEKQTASLDAIAQKNKTLTANNRQLEDKVQARDREIQEMQTRFNEIQNLVSEKKKGS